MDFLDPKLHRRHIIMLYVGYVLIGLAILIGTFILMKIAYGFGLGKNGQVVQNGFLYLSSHPAGADITVNGKPTNSQTNLRLSLPEGKYQVQLNRDGYRPWQRSIAVEGGSVERYDYPLLVPTTLQTKTVKSYGGNPLIATQSPDRRWLLVQRATDETTFDIYDLKNPKVAPVPLTLPAGMISSGTPSTWTLDEWSTDNQHVVLQHNYGDKYEFILVDRTDPTKTVNLNTVLGVNPTKLSLFNKKYDQYYLYDSASQVLSKASLSNPSPVTLLDHVLNYQPYGSDIMLYASSSSSGSHKVAIDLLQGGKTYSLREVAAGTTYLLNITSYSGSWYAAIGASSEGKVYIYKNPASQLNSSLGVLTPIYILKTPNPTYLSFSTSAQFIMDENGSQFSVYDAQYEKGYQYDAKAPLDAPQAHATWMDGDRLVYVSGGKLVMFDYDHANAQTLVSADPQYLPFFDSAYKFMDVLAPSASADKTDLTTTSLLAPRDQ